MKSGSTLAIMESGSTLPIMKSGLTLAFGNKMRVDVNIVSHCNWQKVGRVLFSSKKQQYENMSYMLVYYFLLYNSYVMYLT